MQLQQEAIHSTKRNILNKVSFILKIRIWPIHNNNNYWEAGTTLKFLWISCHLFRHILTLWMYECGKHLFNLMTRRYLGIQIHLLCSACSSEPYQDRPLCCTGLHIKQPCTRVIHKWSPSNNKKLRQRVKRKLNNHFMVYKKVYLRLPRRFS